MANLKEKLRENCSVECAGQFIDELMNSRMSWFTGSKLFDKQKNLMFKEAEDYSNHPERIFLNWFNFKPNEFYQGEVTLLGEPDGRGVLVTNEGMKICCWKEG